ncbi:nuclear RNA export factor 1-like isoform X2, partial [Paramuricea clavata]
MESGSERSQSRYTPYSRPSYRQSGSKFNDSRTVGNQSGETWNKITIPNGRKHDKEWLLSRLQKTCEVSFQPVEFHLARENACFFVNDQRSADALRRISGKVTVRDGSKLYIQVRQCPPPKITSSDQTDGGSSIDQEVLK